MFKNIFSKFVWLCLDLIIWNNPWKIGEIIILNTIFSQSVGDVEIDFWLGKGRSLSILIPLKPELQLWQEPKDTRAAIVCPVAILHVRCVCVFVGVSVLAYIKCAGDCAKAPKWQSYWNYPKAKVFVKLLLPLLMLQLFGFSNWWLQ